MLMRRCTFDLPERSNVALDSQLFNVDMLMVVGSVEATTASATRLSFGATADGFSTALMTSSAGHM